MSTEIEMKVRNEKKLRIDEMKKNDINEKNNTMIKKKLN